MYTTRPTSRASRNDHVFRHGPPCSLLVSSGAYRSNRCGQPRACSPDTRDKGGDRFRKKKIKYSYDPPSPDTAREGGRGTRAPHYGKSRDFFFLGPYEKVMVVTSVPFPPSARFIRPELSATRSRSLDNRRILNNDSFIVVDVTFNNHV